LTTIVSLLVAVGRVERRPRTDAGDNNMADGHCIEATIISHDRWTISLVSKRKNRATAQSNARSDENAWWISAVSELRLATGGALLLNLDLRNIGGPTNFWSCLLRLSIKPRPRRCSCSLHHDASDRADAAGSAGCVAVPKDDGNLVEIAARLKRQVVSYATPEAPGSHHHFFTDSAGMVSQKKAPGRYRGLRFAGD